MKRLGRRQFLGQATALATLPWWRLAAPRRREHSLILIWLDGGLSHLDSFDAKPEAPPDIRGDVASIPTALEGVFFGEHLPLLARRMDRCALIRSISGEDGQHDRASHYMLTGHRPSPVLAYPAMGSYFAAERHRGPLPRYVAVPDAPPHGRQGFLDLPHAPFQVGGDPARPEFQVRDLVPASDSERLADTVRQLDAIDALDGAPRSDSESARDRLFKQALDLSLNVSAREVFDVRREAPAMREKYGRGRLGQSCLLARRLVQAGVRSVLVRSVGWDHHQRIAQALIAGYPPRMPSLDQAVAALLDDLEASGLHEKVTVCVASEFGRTPRLNAEGGRDHWARAQSVLMYGAGIKRGVVVGETDSRGEEPVLDPVSPGDWFATVLAALDADMEQVLTTPDGRPVRVVEEGARPVREVLA